jgi:hypothetical protein
MEIQVSKMFWKAIPAAIFAVVLSISAQAGVSSGPVVVFSKVGHEVVAHGGGCRKDSPPGQCCHAGSQPYHCH